MIHIIIGLLWGLNEGIWFFIVPDICLSFSALSGWRAAALATLSAVVGSLLAAIFLFVGISLHPEWGDLLQNFWSQLPGYYPKMFVVASEHLRVSGAQGLLNGPSSGIPYRFYVLEAIREGLSLSAILLWTPIARLERIIIAPLVVLVLRAAAKRWFEKKQTDVNRNKLFLKALIIIYWVIIYIWYWGQLLPSMYL